MRPSAMFIWSQFAPHVLRRDRFGSRRLCAAPSASAGVESSSETSVPTPSMDLLNFIIGLHKELNVEIPEADYQKLSTLDSCTHYLASVLRVE